MHKVCIMTVILGAQLTQRRGHLGENFKTPAIFINFGMNYIKCAVLREPDCPYLETKGSCLRVKTAHVKKTPISGFDDQLTDPKSDQNL